MTHTQTQTFMHTHTHTHTHYKTQTDTNAENSVVSYKLKVSWPHTFLGNMKRDTGFHFIFTHTHTHTHTQSHAHTNTLMHIHTSDPQCMYDDPQAMKLWYNILILHPECMNDEQQWHKALKALIILIQCTDTSSLTHYWWTASHSWQSSNTMYSY